MGIVEEVGSEVKRLKPGDRVVVPFTISCGDLLLLQRRSTRSATPPTATPRSRAR
jgi:threonine dehydrogenase-like Zn-dependent dehydrogenase